MRKRNVVGTVIMGAIGRRGERKGGAYKEGKRERELEEEERGKGWRRAEKGFTVALI